MKDIFSQGLESLIPRKKSKRTENFSASKKEAIFFVEINKVKSNPYQPRKVFDQEKLEKLKDSVREYGILQPLVVAKSEKEMERGATVEYQLIAGERRLIAARMAGFTQVPVIIRSPSDKERLELSLIENVQRENLNPIEKAAAFQKLRKEFGLSQKEVSQVAGISREAVANTLRLLNLPKEIIESVSAGKITEGHARAILLNKDLKSQKIVFTKILREKSSVREAERLSQKLKVYKPPLKKAGAAFSQKLKNLEKELKEELGTESLALKIESGRPKITIFFRSKKEIENFLKKLKK